MGKTKRAENFTSEQKMGLIEAVRMRETIVQSKQADATMTKKKHKAWDDIAAEMAANFPERSRSAANDLRELWRRMKNKAKAIAREKRIDMSKTGGGLPEVNDVDDETWAILGIIKGDLEQIHNKFDDDAPQLTDHATISEGYADDASSNTTGVNDM